MNRYEEFLAKKQVRHDAVGFEVPDDKINPRLFDWQRQVVKWACYKGQAALFEACGLGKTPQQLEWAHQVHKHTGGDVLILAPLAVAAQTAREGAKFGIPVTVCREQLDVCAGVNVTNYEMLDKFDPEHFAGVVLDECFPPDTPIDVFNIDKSLTCKYIKDVNKNDIIYNANGEDYVKETYKRRINRAVQISYNGRKVTCSENHPFFTVHGWRCAQDLQPGDYLVATGEAMRLVWHGIPTELRFSKVAEVLRSILLSEMEDDPAGNTGEDSCKGSSGKERSEKIRMVSVGRSESQKGNRSDTKPESNVESGNQKKSFLYIAEDEAQTFRSWGQWSRDDIASAIDEGCVVRELDSGISYITGKTKTRFSNMLQGRLGKSRLENSNRGRRELASFEKDGRQKEGSDACFFRVESVEILEPGHPELEKYRDESGIVYFYDIKAKRHPSFSVNGALVHNSSILKSFMGKTKQKLMEAFRRTKYKLACTATPSPNDLMELLNQADFLGIMPSNEALSRWFIVDTMEFGTYRLKGHAEKDFWRWVSSWAVCVNRPSNLGYDDNGFILPPLNTIQHILDDDFDFENGQLFPDYSKLSATDLFRQLRKTTEVRTDKAAELVNGSDETWIVWCNTNDESDALKKKIDQSRTLEVKGSDHHLFKEAAIKWFLDIDLSADEIALITRKNSCLGNQNTRQIDEKNMLKIQKKEIVENNNAELLNKTQNTCEIITPKIKTNSTKEHLKSGQNTIKTEETDTVQMKSIESLQKSKPSNGKEKTHPLKNDNELLPTESTNQDTSTCSTVKKDVVQYADAQTLQTQKYSQLLTTVTKQDHSEDCFACTATWGSENLKTIQNCCEKPLNTSKGKVLISKASMFGFGINLQHCHNMAFVGLSYSFEQRYQAIRRCWRFGQEHEVNDHVIMHPAEVPVWRSVQKKESIHVQLEEKMVNNVVGYSDLNRRKLKLIDYNPTQEMIIPKWLKSA